MTEFVKLADEVEAIKGPKAIYVLVDGLYLQVAQLLQSVHIGKQKVVTEGDEIKVVDVVSSDPDAKTQRQIVDEFLNDWRVNCHNLATAVAKNSAFSDEAFQMLNDLRVATIANFEALENLGRAYRDMRGPQTDEEQPK